MYDYLIQREAQGWSVWTAKPHTGDKADRIRDFTSKTAALRAIYVLRAHAERRAVLTKNINRLIAAGEKPIVEQKA